VPRFRSTTVPALGPIRLAPPPVPFVRRALSRESAQGLEILGHAIEYLADEYAVDPADKGPLGNADPRIAAIQTLKSLVFTVDHEQYWIRERPVNGQVDCVEISAQG
jgi:hypothetical protein